MIARGRRFADLVVNLVVDDGARAESAHEASLLLGRSATSYEQAAQADADRIRAGAAGVAVSRAATDPRLRQAVDAALAAR